MVNLETGERLNMAFGENSVLVSENGRDMKWNPTSNIFGNNGNDVLFGGQHYIYIFGHNANDTNSCPVYDYGAYLAGKFKKTSNNTPSDSGAKRNIFKDAMWVNIPLLSPGHDLFETDVKINISVSKPYAAYSTSQTPENNNNPLYKFTIDKDNLSCVPYSGNANLYPNPLTWQSTLEFENHHGMHHELKIFDSSGKLVKHIMHITTEKIILYKTDFTTGVYYYSLEGEGQKPVVGKFIVI